MMKKQKVVIMNDRSSPMNLKVGGLEGDSYQGVEVADCVVVSILIPEDTTLYLKIWENNTALLSYCQNDFVESLESK